MLNGFRQTNRGRKGCFNKNFVPLLEFRSKDEVAVEL